MQIRILAFIFLFVGCKSIKFKTHPLLRTDGFYYRQKAGDVYQLVRFYRNGRVAVSVRLSKKEHYTQCPNALLRQVDTSLTQNDIKRCSFTLKKDSVYFIKKPDNYVTECYDVYYAIQLHRDSLTGSLQVMNFDSTMLERFQFGKTEIKPKIMTSFKFIKASSKPSEHCPHVPDKDWDIPVKVMNKKLMVEEL